MARIVGLAEQRYRSRRDYRMGGAVRWWQCVRTCDRRGMRHVARQRSTMATAAVRVPASTIFCSHTPRCSDAPFVPLLAPTRDVDRECCAGDVHRKLTLPKRCSSGSASAVQITRPRRPRTAKSGRTRVNGVGTRHTEHAMEHDETEISESPVWNARKLKMIDVLGAQGATDVEGDNHRRRE